MDKYIYIYIGDILTVRLPSDYYYTSTTVRLPSDYFPTTIILMKLVGKQYDSSTDYVQFNRPAFIRRFTAIS